MACSISANGLTGRACYVSLITVAFCAVALGFVLKADSQASQSSNTAANDVFELASVRSVEKPRFRSGQIAVFPGGRFEAASATVVDLIHYAFGLDRFARVEGGPPWVRTEQFDVSARFASDRYAGTSIAATPGRAAVGPIPNMVRQLLTERFNLAVRRETRPAPGRALMMAREDRQLGPRLSPSTLDCPAVSAARIARIIEEGADPNKPENRSAECNVRTTNGQTAMAGHTMAQFAEMVVSNLLQREPVVDRTGLSGTFSIRLTAAPTFSPSPTTDLAKFGPPLETALREQLGLKLERIQVDVQTIIIDRVDRPTPN